MMDSKPEIPFFLPSELRRDSRPEGFPVVLSGVQGPPIGWGDFCSLVEQIRTAVGASPAPGWLVYTEDTYLFLAAFLAVLQAGKEVHLPGSPADLAQAAADSGFGTMSDVWPGADLGLVRPATPLPAAGPFPVVDPEMAVVVLRTSGSTGKPKEVTKHLVRIENEVRNLHTLWGSVFSGAEVVSSVSHQHFYGLLFSALLPLSAGSPLGPARITYPEALGQSGNHPQVFISSPAFLKRMAPDSPSTGTEVRPAGVFSSGGALPPGDAATCLGYFGLPVVEIYGSTETGGIAWRRGLPDERWTIFPGISTEMASDGTLVIRSVYLETNAPYRTEDLVTPDPTGGFRLTGRLDSIVKIEENRVALNDVENRILETGLVADVSVVYFDQGRQYLGAAVVLGPGGQDFFREKGVQETKRWFQDRLRGFFAPVVVPRKWRFPLVLPRNSMNKLAKDQVMALFDEPTSPGTTWEPEVLDFTCGGTSLRTTVVFPPSFAHFRGHFDEIKILPALAQLDYAVKLAVRHLCPGRWLAGVPRIKFIKPIFPSVPVTVDIQFRTDTNQITFSFQSPKDLSSYSSGRGIMEELCGK